MRLHDVPADELFRFATAWARLGDAVQEQVQAAVDAEYDGLDPSALSSAKAELGGLNAEIDEALDDALKALAAAGAERGDLR